MKRNSNYFKQYLVLNCQNPQYLIIKTKYPDAYLENKKLLVEEQVESRGLKDNGIYHYDEQFPRADGESMARLMMLDADTMYPYQDFLENATVF